MFIIYQRTAVIFYYFLVRLSNQSGDHNYQDCLNQYHI